MCVCVCELQRSAHVLRFIFVVCALVWVYVQERKGEACVCFNVCKYAQTCLPVVCVCVFVCL